MNPLARTAYTISFLVCMCLGTQASGQVVSVAIEESYVDPSVLADFEKETGYRVSFADASVADVIMVPQDKMAEAIAKGSIQKIDVTKLANYSNIDDAIISLSKVIDPDGPHAVNYFWFPLVIGYTDEAVSTLGENIIGSLNAIFDPNLSEKIASRCGVAVADDYVVGTIMALKYLGKPVDEFVKASDEAGAIWENTSNKIQFGNGYSSGLGKGTLCLVLAWSNEVRDAKRVSESSGGPRIYSKIPEEGGVVWLDQLAIRTNANNQDGAYAFVDFLLRPDIAERRAEFLGYAHALKGSGNQAQGLTILPHANPKAARVLNRMWVRLKAR